MRPAIHRRLTGRFRSRDWSDRLAAWCNVQVGRMTRRLSATIGTVSSNTFASEESAAGAAGPSTTPAAWRFASHLRRRFGERFAACSAPRGPRSTWSRRPCMSPLARRDGEEPLERLRAQEQHRASCLGGDRARPPACRSAALRFPPISAIWARPAAAACSIIAADSERREATARKWRSASSSRLRS